MVTDSGIVVHRNGIVAVVGVHGKLESLSRVKEVLEESHSEMEVSSILPEKTSYSLGAFSFEPTIDIYFKSRFLDYVIIRASSLHSNEMVGLLEEIIEETGFEPFKPDVDLEESLDKYLSRQVPIYRNCMAGSLSVGYSTEDLWSMIKYCRFLEKYASMPRDDAWKESRERFLSDAI